MHLKLNRIGPVCSDRIILAENSDEIASLYADHSLTGWIHRTVSWIYAPSAYTSENSRAITCVQKYLSHQIGQERLARTCNRYGMDLEQMKTDGSSLSTRVIAKLMTSIRDVKIEDIEELIECANKKEKIWPAGIDPSLRHQLVDIRNASCLKAELFAQVVQALSKAGQFASTPSIEQEMSGAVPTEWLARYFFDPLLADRERLVLCEENPIHSFETFVQNFAIRIIGREMEVGMLVPAPHRQTPNPIPQFYRVAEKIISGAGLVSYLLIPATSDTDLQSIRFARGTATHASAIDASGSFLADFSPALGLDAFESGKIYDLRSHELFGKIPMAAGHSLGSAIVQYMVVENDEIQEAYLLHGPGLPLHYVDKYNQRMDDLPIPKPGDPPKYKLIIRDVSTDLVSSLGTAKIGYKTLKVDDQTGELLPSHVEIDFKIQAPSYQTSIVQAHVEVFGRNNNRCSGLQTGFSPAQINAALHRESHPDRVIHWISNESLRQAIGPFVCVVVLFVRNFFRSLFGSRAMDQLGMQYGVYDEKGRYVTGQEKPWDLWPEYYKTKIQPNYFLKLKTLTTQSVSRLSNYLHSPSY